MWVLFVSVCAEIVLLSFVLKYFYKYAEALQLVLAACKPKAKIVDICDKGDAFIKE